MKSCVKLYLVHAPGLELDKVPSPFLDEDGRDAPSRSPAFKGPVQECPWCEHTFPPSPWPDLRAYDASKKSQRATPAAGGGSLASNAVPPLADAEDRGRLAPVAAKILMRILYGACNARPDILKAVTHLACFFTKWTSLCDRRLHRLVCYIHSTYNYRLVGWIGDAASTLQPYLFADADFCRVPCDTAQHFWLAFRNPRAE